MSLLFTLLILSIVVVFHEMGHLVIAKSNGIYVKEFWVGFGPTLLSFDFHDTKYCLKPIPLGGACVFEEDKKSAKEPDKMFNNAGLLARMSTVFAGPFTNFILAFLISIIAISINPGNIIHTTINEVTPGSAAETAGLLPGDKIVKYDGLNVAIVQDINIINDLNKGKPTIVWYLRNGQKYLTTITPQYIQEYDGYSIGITFTSDSNKPLDIIKNAYYFTRTNTRGTVLGLKAIITDSSGLNDVGGIISIAGVVDTVYKTNKQYGFKAILISILNITIAISTSLGIMNLLPVPGLDGGRLLFMIIEGIRRKPIDKKLEEAIMTVSMGLLIIFMLIITGKDILSLVNGSL